MLASKVNVTDIVCIISIVMDNTNDTSTDTIKVVYQGEIASIEGNFNRKRLKASVSAANVKVTSSSNSLHNSRLPSVFPRSRR